MASERTASEVRAALAKARRAIREAIETLDAEVGPDHLIDVRVSGQPHYELSGMRWMFDIVCEARIREGRGA